MGSQWPIHRTKKLIASWICCCYLINIRHLCDIMSWSVYRKSLDKQRQALCARKKKSVGSLKMSSILASWNWSYELSLMVHSQVAGNGCAVIEWLVMDRFKSFCEVGHPPGLCILPLNWNTCTYLHLETTIKLWKPDEVVSTGSFKPSAYCWYS